jgi:hypothetical protein
MVFNRVYNDVHAFKKYSWAECSDKYLKESETDWQAREEFLAFMKSRFPEVPLIEVYDLVSPTYELWPYLGSIAIDTDIGSPAYQALCEKYGPPEEDAPNNNAVLWVFVSFEEAAEFYEERNPEFCL